MKENKDDTKKVSKKKEYLDNRLLTLSQRSPGFYMPAVQAF